MYPKWYTISYLVSIGLWPKIVHYEGNRVLFGLHYKLFIPMCNWNDLGGSGTSNGLYSSSCFYVAHCFAKNRHPQLNCDRSLL